MFGCLHYSAGIKHTQYFAVGCMQEFSRNVRREVAKLKLLLQQYAIMSTQVRSAVGDWLQSACSGVSHTRILIDSVIVCTRYGHSAAC